MEWKINVYFVLCLLSFVNAIDIVLEEDCLNYTVYPLQYEINIFPYVNGELSYFECDLVITVIANVPNVREISLDSKDLEIEKIKVLNDNRDITNTEVPFEYNLVHGKLQIYLSEPMKMFKEDAGQIYSIHISFKKKVREDGSGIFLVKYYDEQSKDYKYLFTTRLSPNKAKYFFPCFDNPRFEAVFKFKVFILQKNSDMQFTNTTLCIADEQLRSKTLKDDYLIVEYIPSPQVALHQVGLHYSRFVKQEAFSKRGIDRLLLWAPVDEIRDFDFILDFGIKIINIIHEYSKVNKPLVQGPINIIAVPTIITGYEIGSWNLLTNGAHRIAKIDQFTSIRQIETMTFELAQQLSRIWLGNPGEPEKTRWKEEWIKEGLATYYSYYFLTQYNHGMISFPHRAVSAYGLQMKQRAMDVDWPQGTPSLMTFNTSLAIEIPSRYKELVQMKTGAILWMLENWLGRERFHYSLTKYINLMRGKFISLQDFIATLDRDNIECLHQFVNDSTASRIITSWLTHPGYPVINVQVLRDRTPNAIHLKQRQFSYTPNYRNPSNFLIPISYIVQYNQNCYNCYRPRFTIGSKPYTFRENLNDGWILLNRNASGYYRVNYDVETWALIAITLRENMQSIEELNRAQIVNDVLAFFVSGDLSISLAMNILSYLDQERSPIVWDSVLNGYEMFTIERAACNITKSIFWRWENFLAQKLSKIFGQLVKSKDQQPLTRLFRSTIVDLACAINYEPCHGHVRRMYVEERRGKHNFFPDCRIAYFSLIANETFSHTYTRRFNAIEQDDKNIADHKTMEKLLFLRKIPMGEPTPSALMSTSETPMDTQDRPPIETKFRPRPSSAQSLMSSSIIITLTLMLINGIVR